MRDNAEHTYTHKLATLAIIAALSLAVSLISLPIAYTLWLATR